MFTEDLSVFFDDDEFASAVILDGTSVNGILENEPVEDNFVVTTAPFFYYNIADKTPAVNSVLIHGSDTYIVKRPPEVDSSGVCKLKLEKQ